MSTTPALVLSGNLHLARIVNGVTGAESQSLNPTAFEVTPPTDDKLEMVSYKKETYRQVIASMPRIGDGAKISFSFNELPVSQWDLLWMGDASALTQSSGTAVAFSVTATGGNGLFLGHRQLSAVAVTTPSGMVEGTDYTVDYAAGLLYPIPGAGIGSAVTLAGTYSHAAITGKKINAGRFSAIKAKVFVSGKNEYTGDNVMITCYEASLKVSAFQLIGDEFVNVQVEGDLVTPPGKTSPILVEQWTPPAI